MVFTVQFDDINQFDANGLAFFQQNGQFGLINAQGSVVMPQKFKEVSSFSDNGLASFKHNGKYGYINTKGDVAIPAQYEYSGSFSSIGYARVKINGKFGYIDSNAKIVITPEFNTARDFEANGLAMVNKNGPWFYINKTGKKILYRDTVCGETVTKNIDGSVVWPKKSSKEICAEAENSRRQEEQSAARACDHLYVGKVVSWPGSTCAVFSCTDVTFHGEIVGVGSGNASAKITDSLHHGSVHERACIQFK
jgi:hypothetical protein